MIQSTIPCYIFVLLHTPQIFFSTQTRKMNSLRSAWLPAGHIASSLQIQFVVTRCGGRARQKVQFYKHANRVSQQQFPLQSQEKRDLTSSIRAPVSGYNSVALQPPTSRGGGSPERKRFVRSRRRIDIHKQIWASILNWSGDEESPAASFWPEHGDPTCLPLALDLGFVVDSWRGLPRFWRYRWKTGAVTPRINCPVPVGVLGGALVGGGTVPVGGGAGGCVTGGAGGGTAAPGWHWK